MTAFLAKSGEKKKRAGRGRREPQFFTISFLPPKAQMCGVTFHFVSAWCGSKVFTIYLSLTEPLSQLSERDIKRRTIVMQLRIILEWRSKQSYLEDAFCQMLIGQMDKLFQWRNQAASVEKVNTLLNGLAVCIPMLRNFHSQL